MGKKRDDKGGLVYSSASAGQAGPLNNPFTALAGLRPTAAGAEPAPSPAAPTKAAAKPRFEGKLVLQREKKGRGGKTVTRLRGLSLPARGLEELCKELKKGLGCGAVVEDGDVILQGDQCQRAAEWLEKQGAARVIIGN